MMVGSLCPQDVLGAWQEDVQEWRVQLTVKKACGYSQLITPVQNCQTASSSSSPLKAETNAEGETVMERLVSACGTAGGQDL